ncbi:unnamed protein product [Cuscuta europaea]|uniref:Filament-like plant protein 3 n=1 Tax=Cuscuta europaea TaxID=41803 RepID=A0A9P0YNL1_CUSEU|nr:unnamed protein product [Cuscuta europaea]
MEKRSWLWRKKSADKVPSGETESSGSISSHSERFSDDQAIPNHTIQSPEVTSKTTSNDDEHNESVKSLSAKLSEALLNIRAKEDLVKQHSKVAEEAVSGWEKAEAEVLVLKKQVEAATEKNTVLEHRTTQLDGALKECLRQLRQTREDHEEKILEAICTTSSQWESTKSQLEKQISELQCQLETARSEAVMSNLAAETASRQRLESVKRANKLEGECRMLKALAAKTSSPSSAASTDSKSDRVSGIENVVNRSGISDSALTSELNLMDDFLEMERIASSHENRANAAIRNRTNEVEEKLQNLEAEKAKLQTELNRCQFHLKKSNGQLKDTDRKLVEVRAELALANKMFKQRVEKTEMEVVELRNKLDTTQKGKKTIEAELENTKLELKKSMERLEEAEAKFLEIHTQLERENGIKCAVESELKESNAVREGLESRLKGAEFEMQKLQSRVCSLEEEVKKEQGISEEAIAKLKKLESLHLEQTFQIQKAGNIGDFKFDKERELAVAATRFEECKKTIASIGRQLETLSVFEDSTICS